MRYSVIYGDDAGTLVITGRCWLLDDLIRNAFYTILTVIDILLARLVRLPDSTYACRFYADDFWFPLLSKPAQLGGVP